MSLVNRYVNILFITLATFSIVHPVYGELNEKEISESKEKWQWQLEYQFLKDLEMGVDKESGKVEMEDKHLMIGISRTFTLNNISLNPLFGLGYRSSSLNYNNSDGVLNMDAGLSYTLGLDAGFKSSSKLQFSIYTLYSQSNLSGKDFTDRINGRYDVPFNAGLDISEIKAGIKVSKLFDSNQGSFVLSSRLYYANTQADMDIGWFINPAVNMESNDNYGAGLDLSLPILRIIQPKLSVDIGHATSFTLGIQGCF